MSPGRAAFALLLAVLALLVAAPASAHEFRSGLLRVEPLDEAAHRYELVLLTPELSSAGPIPDGELRPIVPEHCALEARGAVTWQLDCGERGLVGTLGVDGLDRHPIDVVVDLRYADGTELSAVLGPDEASVTLDGAATRAGSVFVDYLGLGVEHILLGIDHLLFVLGLVLLVGDRKTLLWTITAFTLAHSLTLASAALELVTLPGPPVEAGIAVSILLLARELALGHDDEQQRDTLTWRYPWLVAFGFGLLHGFGFAGALGEIGLPQDQIPRALLAFNLGVEAGQLGVIAVLLLSFAGLRRLALIVKPSARTEELVRRAPIWAMGGLAFAWTVQRVLGFWT
ncbi:HupE / UreJ protein [Enhygromyxa salina]|uniref:HupE / UreJ protein n=1 Tax=Enhygromyxa salina TaxID=215803 RepID=A0A2S9YF50_9BACT|nr:HupE/UreJ family protein [Enhygromyxa salina]PRQ03738.1 HupE / UreJ protein [Enhygromyxa salina]